MDISEESQKLGRAIELLRESGNWYGLDKSLEISLMEYNFVYKYVGSGTYVVILRIEDSAQIGSGYKVEVIDRHDLLDPRNTHIPIPEFCDNLKDMMGMEDPLLIDHAIKHGDFHVPSHYFDKPHSLDKLVEMLEDAVN